MSSMSHVDTELTVDLLNIHLTVHSFDTWSHERPIVKLNSCIRDKFHDYYILFSTAFPRPRHFPLLSRACTNRGQLSVRMRNTRKQHRTNTERFTLCTERDAEAGDVRGLIHMYTFATASAPALARNDFDG